MLSLMKSNPENPKNLEYAVAERGSRTAKSIEDLIGLNLVTVVRTTWVDHSLPRGGSDALESVRLWMKRGRFVGALLTGEMVHALSRVRPLAQHRFTKSLTLKEYGWIISDRPFPFLAALGFTPTNASQVDDARPPEISNGKSLTGARGKIRERLLRASLFLLR